MKALSLWQPWASAIVTGAKRIETRSWSTKYRGPLAIHAARRCIKRELRCLHLQSPWNAALAPLIRDDRNDDELIDVLPFGAIVAVCELVDCVPVEDVSFRQYHRGYSWAGYVCSENQLGDYSTGRFAWILEGVVALTPIRMPGARGLFDVPKQYSKRVEVAA